MSEVRAVESWGMAMERMRSETPGGDAMFEEFIQGHASPSPAASHAESRATTGTWNAGYRDDQAAAELGMLRQSSGRTPPLSGQTVLGEQRTFATHTSLEGQGHQPTLLEPSAAGFLASLARPPFSPSETFTQFQDAELGAPQYSPSAGHWDFDRSLYESTLMQTDIGAATTVDPESHYSTAPTQPNDVPIARSRNRAHRSHQMKGVRTSSVSGSSNGADHRGGGGTAVEPRPRSQLRTRSAASQYARAATRTTTGAGTSLTTSGFSQRERVGAESARRGSPLASEPPITSTIQGSSVSNGNNDGGGHRTRTTTKRPTKPDVPPHKITDQRRREDLKSCFSSLLSVLPVCNGDEQGISDTEDVMPVKPLPIGGLTGRGPNRVDILKRTLDFINFLQSHVAELEDSVQNLSNELASLDES